MVSCTTLSTTSWCFKLVYNGAAAVAINNEVISQNSVNVPSVLVEQGEPLVVQSEQEITQQVEVSEPPADSGNVNVDDSPQIYSTPVPSTPETVQPAPQVATPAPVAPAPTPSTTTGSSGYSDDDEYEYEYEYEEEEEDEDEDEDEDDA